MQIKMTTGEWFRGKDLEVADRLLQKGQYVWGYEETPESLYDSVRSGKSQLWLVETELSELLMLTSLHVYPSGLKTLEIDYIMGEGLMRQEDTLKHLMRKMYMVAQYADATAVRINASKGLARLLKKAGMKEEGSSMIYELDRYREGMH